MSQRRRRTAPGLDGVRALAVLLVIVFHVDASLMPGGYVGVDVFFVLSGFLITTVLLEDAARDGRFDLPAFWVRRARRLFPAATLLIVVVAAATLAVGRDTGAGLRAQVVGGLTWTSNWFQVANGWAYAERGEPPVLNHLWSLGIEEQFYLLWPALLGFGLLVLSRRWMTGVVVVLSVASAVAMAWLFVPDDPTRAYVGTDSHAFGLLIGAAVALSRTPHLLRSDRAPATTRQRATMTALGVGGAAVVGAYAAYVGWGGAAPYWGGLVVASLGAAGLVVAAANKTVVASVLSTPPLRWLGARSYGIYLWHWPLIVFAVRIAPPEAAVPAGIGAVVVAVAVAAWSYRFVEMPMRRDGIWLTLRHWAAPVRRVVERRGRPRWVWVAAAGSVAGVMVAASLAVGTAPDRSVLQASLSQGQLAIAAAAPETEASSAEPAAGARTAGADTAGRTAPAATCRTAGTSVRVSAFGDSVLIAAAPELVDAMPRLDATAKVGWQYADVVKAVRKAASRGRLGPVVVIATGTNGLIDRADLERLVTRQLRDREVLLVSPYVPGRSWQKGALSAVRKVAGDHDHVRLADWHGAAKGRDGLLASDRVHPNERGSREYVKTLRETLGGC